MRLAAVGAQRADVRTEARYRVWALEDAHQGESVLASSARCGHVFPSKLATWYFTVLMIELVAMRWLESRSRPGAAPASRGR